MHYKIFWADSTSRVCKHCANNLKFVSFLKSNSAYPDAQLSPDGVGGIPQMPPTAVPTPNPIPGTVPPTPATRFQQMKLEKKSRLEQEGIDEVSPLSRGIDSRVENAAATTGISYKTHVMKHQSHQNARKVNKKSL